MHWIEKYADLLVNYSLYLKEGEKVFVRSTTLAEPLVKAFYTAGIKSGAIVETELSFEDQESILLQYGNSEQLEYVGASYQQAIQSFDAYLVIRAPYESNCNFSIVEENRKIRSHALAPFDQMYFQRLGDGSLKRSLCQFPTQHAATIAGMDLDEYTQFIVHACFLDMEHPADQWKAISLNQQRIVDYFNGCNHFIYKNPNFEICFSTLGRSWINSDGKANMPSGEVFTSPVEDSVSGQIYFSYPSIMMNEEVSGVHLIVDQGNIIKWSAETGQHILDKVFQIPGARVFGEAAVATNHNIQRATKNILFDEKIGGTIHMAVGQSYLQAGGKNISSIHWDLITDMKQGGEILADGEVVYRNGAFLI